MKTKFSFYKSVLIALCLALLAFSVALAASGGLDTTFSGDGKITQDFGGSYHSGWDIAVQSDGKVVVVGDKVWSNSNGIDFAIARYTTAGILDKTFSGDGLQTVRIKTGNQAYTVALQTDGKIVVGGTSDGDVGLARLNADGTPDATFGVNGKVTTDVGALANSGVDIAMQGNKIVVVGCLHDGTDINGAVYRYNENGSLDTAFNGSGILPIDFGQDELIAGVAVYGGKIYVAGSTMTDQAADFIVARINANGTLDSTFGVGGKVRTNLGGFDYANGLAISAGKVVVVGSSDNKLAMVQYTAAGKLDTAFGVGGKIRANLGLVAPGLYKVAIQSGGKIVAVGCTNTYPGDTDALLVRYTAAGKLDTTFGAGGKVVTDWGGQDKYYSVVIKNARIYTVGTSKSKFIIARYLP
jgi:uncharacterized delta-60 repeat protein